MMGRGSSNDFLRRCFALIAHPSITKWGHSGLSIIKSSSSRFLVFLCSPFWTTCPFLSLLFSSPPNKAETGNAFPYPLGPTILRVLSRHLHQRDTWNHPIFLMDGPMQEMAPVLIQFIRFILVLILVLEIRLIDLKMRLIQAEIFDFIMLAKKSFCSALLVRGQPGNARILCYQLILSFHELSIKVLLAFSSYLAAPTASCLD